ncbi:MAG TPA: hydrogenase maturation protease [Ignavibacteria bacterium]|jgi:hydrogenase maturation protease
MNNPNRILILALGNDIMGDDAAGLIAARELKKEFGSDIDIFEVSSAGFSLMDILEGYRKVLVLDTIPASSRAEISIKELSKEDLLKQHILSPHYVGIPELMELAKKLNIKFPDEVRVLVIGIHDGSIIREGLSDDIKDKIPLLVEKASRIIEEWLGIEIFLEWQAEIDEP